MVGAAWLASTPALAIYLQATLWASGFLFLGLALDGEPPFRGLLVITGLALPALALMSASVAIEMCGNYPKVKVDERKASMRKLIDLYKKHTSDAAGKDRESKQMQMYLKTKPAFDKTLKALSGGEELDSAEAWDTWLRENMTKKWDEE